MRCACYERRLSSSEVVSYDGCSRSVIRMHLVVVIAVLLSGMYVMYENDYLSRGRDRKARSM